MDCSSTASLAFYLSRVLLLRRLLFYTIIHTFISLRVLVGCYLKRKEERESYGCFFSRSSCATSLF